MPKLQPLVLVTCAFLGAGFGSLAMAQDGFYGLSLRDSASPKIGLSIGSGLSGLSISKLPMTWNRFSAATFDDNSTQRVLAFGGYRWKNDVAVAATFNAADSYAFGPASLAAGGNPAPLADSAARSWNADLYTSWEFIRSLSLYGRLGYSQTEIRPLFAGASVIPGDPRRRDGVVNYGLGFRYDMTHSLGMRVEYARFGRFSGDVSSSGLPDSDQVSIGLQFRF